MSINLTPVITLAGLQAVLNATDDGLQARITEVVLGDQGWQPTPESEQLQNELARVPVSNGRRLQPTQIHVTAVENGDVEYWVREIGFVLDDGTLLAIWSHPTQALAWKASGVDLLLAFDLVVAALPADSIIVDGTGGVNLAPATLEEEGVVRLATASEAMAGSLATAVAMTPATTRALGDARYTSLGHRHPWGELEGVPNVFPPEDHDHDTRYTRTRDFRVTTGFSLTNNRHSQGGWVGYTDWTRNYVDIPPPSGFTINDLLGFMATPGVIYFGGDVNNDDILYIRWRRQSNNIRVICNNSENRSRSYIHYMGIWRK